LEPLKVRLRDRSTFLAAVEAFAGVGAVHTVVEPYSVAFHRFAAVALAAGNHAYLYPFADDIGCAVDDYVAAVDVVVDVVVGNMGDVSAGLPVLSSSFKLSSYVRILVSMNE
jgi:hypothetical protein